jgi:KUP system potassium uptake protein
MADSTEDGAIEPQVILPDIMSTQQVTAPTPAPVEDEKRKFLALQRARPIFKYLRNIFECMGFAFGPLAISPLFTFNSIIEQRPTDDEILGALSLCIYTIIFTATIQYMIIELSKNNSGEGGMFSLAALVLDSDEETTHTMFRKRLKQFCNVLTILGISFLLGNTIQTPPLAILAALDGLETWSPSLLPLVVPITCILLTILFAIQRLGISKVRLVFGGIMIVWSLCLLLLGIYNITQNTRCFLAFNPAYIIMFFDSYTHFHMFAGVVLVLSGIQMVHKEIGRFGVGPIRIAWIVVVAPSLLISYLGQGASLLNKPENYWNPFYLSTPLPVFWPVMLLAIVATVIASHSVINSAFNLISQAIALDYFPNVSMQRTSRTNKSEVFIPSINLLMMFGAIMLAIVFRSSFNLSDAYGLSLTVNMIVTTLLFVIVVWISARWHWALRMLAVVPYLIVFLPMNFLYVAANILKIPSGAWVSPFISIVIVVIMSVWTLGQHKLSEINNADIVLSYDEFNTKYTNLPRSKGIGVFLVNNSGGIPTFIKKQADVLGTLPEVMIFMTVKYFKVPYIAENKRMTTVFINDNMIRVTARYGFLEKNVVLPNIISEVIKKYDLQKFVTNNQVVRTPTKTWDDWLINMGDLAEEEDASSVMYYLCRDYVRVNRKSMFLWRWMITLFVMLKSGTKNETNQLFIPGDKVFEIGNVVWL